MIAHVAMAQFRDRLLSYTGYHQDPAGKIRGNGRVVQLTYALNEVTVAVFAAGGSVEDRDYHRVRYGSGHFDKLDMVAVAIAEGLDWPEGGHR